MWLPPALGMPVAILWEWEGGKGPLGQPSTEPGMGSQAGARKISGCFYVSKLSISATPGCSAVPPPPLNAPAIQGCCNQTAPSPLELAGVGQNPTQPQPGTTTPALHPTCPSGAAVAVAVPVAVAVAWREGAGEKGSQLSRGCLQL